MKFIIHAPNIHQGGGEVLLSAIFRSLDSTVNTQVVVDSRMRLPEEYSDNISVSKIKSNVVGRLKADWDLTVQTKPGDVVLCFGNLPPLLPVRGHVFVFLQNRCLVENRSLKEYKVFTMIRLYIERMWLRLRKSAIKNVIVQTPTMKALVKKALKMEATILPIYNADLLKEATHAKIDNNENTCDFIYVANYEPHKNHINLIKAWQLLADEGIFPSLCLTLEQAEYDRLISSLNSSGEFLHKNIRITNVGLVNHSDLLQLYQRCQALIYPSVMESFGIPLFEAKEIGIPIIASELDYVRDVVELEESFDPYSPISIKRAVKRLLNKKEETTSPLNMDQFLKKILEMSLS